MTVLLAALSGCGAYVPDVIPSGKPHATAFFVNKIVNHVKCELREAVRYKIAYDVAKAAQQPGGARKISWIDDWGAKLTIKLVIVEKSGTNPGISVFNPRATAIKLFSTGPVAIPRSFTLGAGGSLSSEATRTENVDFYISFRDEFLDPKKEPRNRPVRCIGYDGPLLEGDLKIRDWVDLVTFPHFLPNNISPRPPEAVSHQVSFVLAVSGNINPTWRLVEVTANSGQAPLFSANRTQTSDLTITMGPTYGSQGKTASDAVNQAHFIARQQSAFSTAITNQR